MSNDLTPLDGEVAANIGLAAEVASCIVVAGVRQFDRFLLANAEGTLRILSLERLCHERMGARATWVYDPARGQVSLHRAVDGFNPSTALPVQPGTAKVLPFIEVLTHFANLKLEEPGTRLVLLVDAALLFEDAAAPHAEDFQVLQAIERFTRATDGTRTLLLRVARTTLLPGAILTAPLTRTVPIPAASRDTRHLYARLRGQGLAEQLMVTPDAVARVLSDATEDWTLDQVDALLRTAERQTPAALTDLEELARAVRLGTTQSPWAGERIRTAVKDASESLTRRVIGQPQAVGAVVTALRKAVVGLSSAHQSLGSQAPRAIFFFAGPTGTGKTELAKAISQLVFGQEQLLRFDCGELRQEHAVARLIGAPPGYVGYDRGGELTEGIRAKPNSVVLFDEIEKAHPRLLDTLLGVLDDGRLTSGQGETSYFGQAVLIFTSNLGMYEEIPTKRGLVTRQPRFGYDTEFPVIEAKVREAIREAFVTDLGRPELLGRFGGAESIVVFDYLRELERVCRKFVANIAAECRRLHGVELVVDDAVVRRVAEATQQRREALVLGGRGLRPELDRWLTDPLAEYLFTQPRTQGRLQAFIEGEQTRFASS